RCSIARHGDGEFRVALGYSIPFQEHSPELARRLKEVLASSDPRLLVGIPDVFGSLQGLKPEYRLFWRTHLAAYRNAIYELLSFKKTYYDALFSRPYIIYENASGARAYFDKLKQVWRGREVVLIEGEQSRLGMGNDLLAATASVRRILGPPRNAFQKY